MLLLRVDKIKGQYRDRRDNNRYCQTDLAIVLFSLSVPRPTHNLSKTISPPPDQKETVIIYNDDASIRHDVEERERERVSVCVCVCARLVRPFRAVRRRDDTPIEFVRVQREDTGISRVRRC